MLLFESDDGGRGLSTCKPHKGDDDAVRAIALATGTSYDETLLEIRRIAARHSLPEPEGRIELAIIEAMLRAKGFYQMVAQSPLTLGAVAETERPTVVMMQRGGATTFVRRGRQYDLEPQQPLARVDRYWRYSPAQAKTQQWHLN